MLDLKGIRFHAGLAALVRLAFLGFGIWQDAHMLVKYTDVDYKVFTDASRHVVHNRSPYDRHTYRYSPLVAWMLVPNVILDPNWGKLLFVVADVACGCFVYVLVKSELIRERAEASGIDWTSVKAACLWLYNPLTIVVSTRGSADAVPSLLVLLTLVFLKAKCVKSAGLAFGLAVHFKIYPIIYSLSIFLSLRTGSERVKWSDFVKWNKSQVRLTVLTQSYLKHLFSEQRGHLSRL
jgi:phosphatidylinositol glycan class M